MTDAREIIAQTLGHHPGWSRTTDAILAALTAAGYRILAPEEVDPVTVEKCALAAQAAIESEAYDLSDIRDGYIEARKTGWHSGRRISDDLAKSFAGKFAERSDAVYLVAEIATTRIRALKEKRPVPERFARLLPDPRAVIPDNVSGELTAISTAELIALREKQG